MTQRSLKKIFSQARGRSPGQPNMAALLASLFSVATKGQTQTTLQLARQWHNASDGSDARDTLDRTPVHAAAQYGQTETAIALVKAGWQLDPYDEDGYTPLMVAISHGHADTVRTLIKAGADIHAREIYGRTPLHVAAKEGRAEIAHILIKEGADTSLRCKSGKTPLETTFWLAKPDDPNHRQTANRILEAISLPHAHKIKALKTLR